MRKKSRLKNKWEKSKSFISSREIEEISMLDCFKKFNAFQLLVIDLYLILDS